MEKFQQHYIWYYDNFRNIAYILQKLIIERQLVCKKLLIQLSIWCIHRRPSFFCSNFHCRVYKIILFYLILKDNNTYTVPRLWPSSQTASRRLLDWWPRCPHLLGQTRPDHRTRPCVESPGCVRWCESGPTSWCLGKVLRGRKAPAHLSTIKSSCVTTEKLFCYKSESQKVWDISQCLNASQNDWKHLKLTAATVSMSNTLVQYRQAFALPYLVWHSSTREQSTQRA